MIDHIYTERLALDALDQFDITDPVVDALKIAKGVGVAVEEIPMAGKLSNVAGFYDGKKKIIYLNKDDTPVRKQFSLAHELGHIFLQHKNYDALFRIPHKEALYSKEESEANSFAAKLLMPDFMIKEYLQKYNLTKGDYSTMAKIFGVPKSAMKHTLEHLH